MTHEYNDPENNVLCPLKELSTTQRETNVCHQEATRKFKVKHTLTNIVYKCKSK